MYSTVYNYGTYFFRGQVNLFWSHETQPAKPSQQYRLCTNTSARGTTFHTQLDIHAPCDVLWTRPESGNTFFLNLAGILTVLGEDLKTRILRAIYVF